MIYNETILQKRTKEHWDQNGVNLPKLIKNKYFIKHKAVNYVSEALNNVFVITYDKYIPLENRIFL